MLLSKLSNGNESDQFDSYGILNFLIHSRGKDSFIIWEV